MEPVILFLLILGERDKGQIQGSPWIWMGGGGGGKIMVMFTETGYICSSSTIKNVDENNSLFRWDFTVALFFRGRSGTAPSTKFACQKIWRCDIVWNNYLEEGATSNGRGDNHPWTFIDILWNQNFNNDLKFSTFLLH